MTTTPITPEGVDNAIKSGLITVADDGDVTFRLELLPTTESRAAELAYQTWDEAGRPTSLSARRGIQHPLLNACINTSVKAGLYCPQEVADWLGIDPTHIYHPLLNDDTFTRTAIDSLIESGLGNAAIRDLAKRYDWPVTTARVATRRNRLNNRTTTTEAE